MVIIPTSQEEIEKARKTPALIKNRLGVEVVIDLYTAKKLASNNEAEILDENFQEQKSEKTPSKTPSKTSEKTAEKTAEKTTK